ncbi:hypothetical protein M0R45_012816 [Rubus argutus]|uniref:PGG domain-containing protein n=1 Tax=Rubus argutus TaxID=59490 RepID=A0AAW1XHQ2_RUBAR
MAENTSISEYQKSRHLYQSLRNGHITEVMKAYDEAKASTPDARLELITTLHGDTILHMAIYIDQHSIAKKIIEKCSGDNDVLLTKKNAFGNTVLHEAAATDHKNLVEMLLDKAPALLSMANNIGEMPLYTAAYFGQTENFKLLAAQVLKKHPNDLRRHLCTFYDPDSSPTIEAVRSTVLHAAINSEFFEFALLIARNQDYAGIIELKYKNSMTSLQLLSCNPSAFRSGTKYGLIKSLIYNCAPYENAHKQNPSDDSNGESSSRATLFLRPVISFLRRVISSGWSSMRKIYEEKKKHESALDLAKLLIAADFSWDDRRQLGDIPVPGGVEPDVKSPTRMDNPFGGEMPSLSQLPDIPLFLAASHGILEIVKEILEAHASAYEYRNKKRLNILHVAIMHRQSHIFDMVTKMETPKSRLVQQIDRNGYTILHHVGITDFRNGGTKPGPALQLQEELEWFEKVEKIVPPHYAMIRVENEEMETLQLSENQIIPSPAPHLGRDKKSKKETAREYFRRTHADLLKDAQEWLKQTSESCSTVAGLMATVAFAAAFTVPGGNNEKNGQPILLQNPFFLVFIITDALSLASSLTSLVMFLSILTSPFELDDFHHSLPRKVILGFTFLFFSVAVTMLAFASTLMLTIPIKRRLTTTFVYCVAFLPVTMFALLQFPLYVAFKTSLEYSFTAIKSLLPSGRLISKAIKKDA